MRFRIKYPLLILAMALTGNQQVAAKKIHNPNYNFSFTIPNDVVEVIKLPGNDTDLAFYDTTTRLIFTVSAQESKFRSVKDYLDCSTGQLEQQLKNNFDDTTLVLLSCGKSNYYPAKTTVLHFKVLTSASGNNYYLIYFIHHHHKDIQLLFNYNKETEQASLDYIDGVMKSLRLK